MDAKKLVKRSSFLLFCSLLVCLFAAGCLTAEHKEMRISLSSDGKSGSGTIVFTGIASEKGEDTASLVKEDFNSLISEYYQGKTLETGIPALKNVKKRLFVKDGQLIGELSFDFDDLSKIGFYKFKGAGPYMYYTLSEGYFTSGQFGASNGTYGGDKMPVVFWDEGTKDFYLKMSLTSPGSVRVPLADKFTEWEKK